MFLLITTILSSIKYDQLPKKIEKTTTEADVNLCSGLGQAQQFSIVKHVYRILVNLHFGLMHIL